MTQTIISAFKDIVERRGCQIALQYKVNGQWIERTWQQYWDEAMLVAGGLADLGLTQGDVVAILSNNRREWLSAYLGASAAACVPTGLYPETSERHCFETLRHCGAAVVFVENQVQLNKIYAWRAQLPRLQAIILMDGRANLPAVYSWHQLLRRGRQQEEVIAARALGQRAEDLACMSYTGGGPGRPKAVMLSHRNLLWTARTLATQHLKLGGGDSYLSHLPLAHIAEQLAGIFMPLCYGYRVYFAESKAAVLENLQEVRPSFLLGAPALWRAMRQSLLAPTSTLPAWQRSFLNWEQRGGQRDNDQRHPMRWGQRLLGSQVKRALGLDRCRYMISAASRLSEEMLRFFHSLGLPLYEAYGLSECCGPVTISLPDEGVKPGRAGRPLAESQIHIAADSEIYVKGPHVFLGYWGDKARTEKVLRPDGWLATGDLGQLDGDGFLQFIGRKGKVLSIVRSLASGRQDR